MPHFECRTELKFRWGLDDINRLISELEKTTTGNCPILTLIVLSIDDEMAEFHRPESKKLNIILVSKCVLFSSSFASN